MYRRKFNVVLFILICLVSGNGKANFHFDTVPSLFFEQVTNIQNTSFGIVEDIVQDSLGFIWIGSSEGLFRYDGVKFKNYTYRRDDSTSLRSNLISDLHIDRKSNLWIATENGINRYNIASDDFTYYPVMKQTDKSEQALFISAVTEDRTGSLWVATIDNGVYQFGGKQNSFIPLPDLVKTGKGYNKSYIQTIYVDSENILWIGTIREGIQYYQSDDQSLHMLSEEFAVKKISLGEQILAITEDINGTIWFGTKESGLFSFNKITSGFEHYSEGSSGKYRIGTNTIWDIMVDREDKLWVCTDGGGLLRYNREQKDFTAFTNDKSPGCISSNIIRSIFEDAIGNFWIGSFDSPINFVDKHRKRFFLARDFITNKKEKSRNRVTSMLIDTYNRVWIGTDGAGIITYPPGSSMPQHINTRNVPAGYKNDKPICFDEDKRGNVWIGYYEGGLARYDRKKNSFKYYYPDGSDRTPIGKQIWGLLATENSLWIGSELGIEVMDMETGIFSFDIETTDGSTQIRQGSGVIVQDLEERVLIGSHTGLYVYDTRKLDLKHYLPVSGDTTSLAHKWVTCILFDSKNRYWLGTSGGGLSLWDGYNSFKTYNIDDGLAGEVIKSIEEDMQGNIWLVTDAGISKLESGTNQITNFYVGDGIQESNFYTNSSFTDNRNFIYVGGKEGITYFIPKQIKTNIHIPPIRFTELIKHNQQASGTRNTSMPITGTDEIELKSGNFFTIEFAVLNYAQAYRNQYKYRLKGYHKNWQDNGNSNSVTFSNLKSGKYVFEVMASNQDNVWNREKASVRIHVYPPFYKTFWFVILMLLFVAVIIYKLHWLFGKKLKMQATNLTDQVAARTKELEQRSIEIDSQKQKITEQRDLATLQRDQITRQKEELEEHRSRLEELVEERTQDLVQAKEMAEAGDRLKTAFLENLSHQIRTPMNVILGFINLLTEKIDDVVSREYYLRIINESGTRMLGLIHDIIDFSKMQTGELQPEYSECNISQIIREIVTSIRERLARENGMLSVLTDLPEDDIVMYCDENKLKQIVTKLLENALEHTDKGYIKAGVSEMRGKGITFYIEDTGTTIESGQENEIFDRFYTAQEHTVPNAQIGSGLGLAFAKVAVELLGGKIWVKPSSENGAAFYFILPFMQVTANISTPQSKESTYSWPDKRILVAEDEDSNYLLIEAILRDTGVSLVHVTDGVELLEIIDTGEKFDLVLLDLKMPRMGGINAMKIIRESNKEIPVIVQTAYDQTNHRQQCIEFGCNDFLVKPLRKKELLASVDKYLS